MRIWRNWQTRMVQVHVKAISWRFKSSYPHHNPVSYGTGFFMKGGEFMAVYSVDELRMIVSDIAKQYGVKKVALFGSYSTGKQTSESDIDLLIDKGDIKGLFMLNSFINSLQDKLGKDVDVMTYDSLDRSLIKDYLNNEIVLYKE